jgi:hypothetical protein
LGALIPRTTLSLCFVNPLNSVGTPEQLILIIDIPTAGDTKTFPQPKHGFKSSNSSPGPVGCLKTTNLWHVLLDSKLIAFNALLQVLGDVMHGVRVEQPFIDRGFNR